MKAHLRTTIETLASRGVSHREIERRTGVDRKTIRRYAGGPKSPRVATGSDAISEQTPPPRPPAPPGEAPPLPMRGLPAWLDLNRRAIEDLLVEQPVE